MSIDIVNVPNLTCSYAAMCFSQCGALLGDIIFFWLRSHALMTLTFPSCTQVCMALEEEFVITIPDAEAEKILSVEDAINFVATHPQAK